jgi:phage tail sheath gpL-like
VIQFQTIPSDLLAPGFYAEIDASQASSYTQNLRTIIFGYHQGKPGQAGVLQQVGRAEAARSQFGWGSMLARQIAAFRKNNPWGELWAYPLTQPSGGAQASGTVTFSGTATAAGHVYLYVAGQLIQVPIPTGTTAVGAATLTRRAIARVRNSVEVYRELPVVGTNFVDEAATAVLTITAKNIGIHGNLIDIQLNFNKAGGERLPPGLTATVVAMSGGTGTTNLTSALAAIGDEPFEYWVTPFNSAGDLTTITDFLESRWGPMKQFFGSVWTAKRDTSANLDTYGDALNEKTLSVFGYPAECPSWEPEVGAAYAGIQSFALSQSAPQSTVDMEVVGVVPPPFGARWDIATRDQLLKNGISPMKVEGGKARITQSVTTYQVNDSGGEDASFRFTTYTAALPRIIREVQFMVQSRYGRSMLAKNSSKIGSFDGFVTPAEIKVSLVTQYQTFVARGLADDPETFAAELVVEPSETVPGRIDILYPPTLLSPLGPIAAKIEFRL